MFTKAIYASTLLSALAVAAPAPQVPGYSDADFPITVSQPTGSLATSFGPDSQINAIPTTPGSAPPRRSSDVTGATSHGPFSGTATTTGAEKAPTTLGSVIAPLPPNPTATYYNANGKLQNPAPIPYTPAG
jgi:hypothetical protein